MSILFVKNWFLFMSKIIRYFVWDRRNQLWLVLKSRIISHVCEKGSSPVKWTKLRNAIRYLIFINIKGLYTGNSKTDDRKKFTPKVTNHSCQEKNLLR